MIDTDNGFNGTAALKFLTVDAPVVVANYPKRRYNFRNALNRTFTSEEDLINAMLEGTAVGVKNSILPDGSQEMLYGGGGMMLIRREVFEAILAGGLVEKIHEPNLPAGIEKHLWQFFDLPNVNGGKPGARTTGSATWPAPAVSRSAVIPHSS